MNFDFYQYLISKIPVKRKITPSGYISYNCPVCQAMGEPRPDKNSRAGIKHEEDYIIINCFNCNFKAIWKTGYKLSKKFKFYLTHLSVPQEEILNVGFKLWKDRNINGDLKEEKTYNVFDPVFEEKELPKNSKPIEYWLSLEHPPEDFIKVYDYLKSRGKDIYRNYNYYWSPEKEHNMNTRIIIPFYWNNKIVGWTGRNTSENGVRYYTEKPANYIFNNKVIDYINREFLLLVEGPFDAIAIDGISPLGNNLNENQIAWINSFEREIIVVPDQEMSGRNLVKMALENNWSVSIPEWGPDIKDTADAVKKFGRLYTLKSILESKSNNKLKIEVLMKTFMK